MVAIWNLVAIQGCEANCNPYRNPGWNFRSRHFRVATRVAIRNPESQPEGPKIHNPGCFYMVAIRVANRVSIAIWKPWNILERWLRPGCDLCCDQGCNQGCDQGCENPERFLWLQLWFRFQSKPASQNGHIVFYMLKSTVQRSKWAEVWTKAKHNNIRQMQRVVILRKIMHKITRIYASNVITCKIMCRIMH